MPIFKLKLTDRYEIAQDTIVFVFSKPENFNFKAGQYGGFTLINPAETDASGITRRFSLLNAPDENCIAFATRIQKSAYKRMLNKLVIGDEIKFAGPTGTFTLHDDLTTPAVLIAGGIGITPFYSMIKQAVLHPTFQQLYLFYGNQNLAQTSFLSELQNIEKNNSHFKLIPTMAAPDPTWQGETGFITDQMIKKYLPDIFSPFYYICGSPAMVTALQETLAEMGIDEDRIKVEDFPGY